jgi:hypothetical protein
VSQQAAAPRQAPAPSSADSSSTTRSPTGSRTQTPDAGQTLPTARFSTPSQEIQDRDGLVRVSVELSTPAPHDLTIPATVLGDTSRLRATSVGRSFTASLPAQRFVVPAGATHAELVLSVAGREDNGRVDALVVRLQSTPEIDADDQHIIHLTHRGLGDPLPDLTPDELDAFNRGRVVFERRFNPSEGLGPFYNATSCSSCHSTPVIGGTSALYRNFYLGVYQFGSTVFSQSTAVPPFLSQVIPAFGTGLDHGSATFSLEGGRVDVPETVFGFPVISAQRNSIPLFGVGLFEFISNQTIFENNDPVDLDGDGISGQPNTQINGTAIGRFGTKAQVNNIELFTRAPLQTQMGITSEPFEGSNAVVSFRQASTDPNAATEDNDGVPDPEISRQDLGDLIAFTKFLAPPVKRPFSDRALRGETFFVQAGCAKCHVPSLASSRGPVDAYTDLLMHDMGEDLADDIRLGDNPGSIKEFRTQPLWGISHAAPYLHDGRAATLEEAITAHDGEGAASRDAFLAMPLDRRQAIIEFLEHL